jgi:glyoxylase-like metal-dependent hydrolase (beta-lactamase superfamily II)/rhodanese-related sulfurtransferase
MSLEITRPWLVVRQLSDRDTWTYTYLLIDPVTRQGVLIDPVREQLERDLGLIRELGVELLYVLETHVHADHVTSAGMIRQQTGAQIVYSVGAGMQAIDVAVVDGSELRCGQYKIRAIATPGHTDGCMSYYVDGMLFTGDALLIRGCGRTDFQQGNADTLYNSITQKLFTLPDSTIVYPAHDYNGRSSSTIGEEKQWNPRLGNNRSRDEFVAIMNNLNLDLPKKINEAVPANRECGISFDPKRYLHEEFSMQGLYKVWGTLAADELIVDNRTPEEYEIGHVPGSRNIPFGSEGEHVDELKKYRRIYLYCRSGRRAQTTFTNLSIMGLNNLVCVGHSGMPQWVLSGFPVES